MAFGRGGAGQCFSHLYPQRGCVACFLLWLVASLMGLSKELTSTCMYEHAQTHACTHAHAHTHARTRTHAHAYAHAHAQFFKQENFFLCSGNLCCFASNMPSPSVSFEDMQSALPFLHDSECHKSSASAGVGLSGVCIASSASWSLLVSAPEDLLS